MVQSTNPGQIDDMAQRAGLDGTPSLCRSSTRRDNFVTAPPSQDRRRRVDLLDVRAAGKRVRVGVRISIRHDLERRGAAHSVHSGLERAAAGFVVFAVDGAHVVHGAARMGKDAGKKTYSSRIRIRYDAGTEPNFAAPTQKCVRLTPSSDWRS